jgi:hypothetical protein
MSTNVSRLRALAVAPRNDGVGIAWVAFALGLGGALAGALLDVVPEDVRALCAWSVVGGAVLTAFGAPLRYAAGWIVSCLTVQEWLSRSAGLAEGRIPGVNASTIVTAAGLAAYAVRFGRSPLPASSATSLRWWIGLFAVADLSVALRGHGFELAHLAQWGSGYLRLLCIYLWARRVALASPTDSSRRAAFLYCIGPALVGYSTFSAVFGAGVADIEELSAARIAGLYDPNLTMTGVGLVALLAMIAMTSRRPGRRWGSAPYLLAAAALVLAVYSGSRTATGALLMGLVVLTSLMGARRLALAAVAAAVVAVGVWNTLPDALRERFADAAGGYQATRIPVLANAWEAFLEHPVLGGGRDGYRFRQGAFTNQVAHNTFLGLLAEGGVIQATAYVGAVVALVLHARRLLSRTGDSFAALAIAMTALWVVAGNALSFSLGDYCSSILVAGVVTALSRAERTAHDAKARRAGASGASLPASA